MLIVDLVYRPIRTFRRARANGAVRKWNLEKVLGSVPIHHHDGTKKTLVRELARIGFRNALRRKRVAAVTVMSIAISVSLLYTALSASSSLENSANLFLKATLSPVDISVSATRWGQPITTQMRSDILSGPSVMRAIPRIEEYATYENLTSGIYVFLVGLDLQSESGIGSLNATAGSLDISGDGCFLTMDAIELLNVSLGDLLTLHTSAAAAFFNITGYGLAIDKGVIGPVVFISLERAWEIYSIRYEAHSSNKLLIELYDVFAAPAATDYIKAVCGEGFTVTNLKVYPLKLSSLFLSQAQTVLLALVAVSSFTAVFRVFSSFAMIFSQRRYETGVVLAFGASRSNVLVLLLAEVGTIGIVGAALGIGLGLVIGTVVLNFLVLLARITYVGIMSQYFRSLATVDPLSVIIACLFGIALTLMAGYLPAWRASRESVATSLGSGALPPAGAGRLLSRSGRKRVRAAVGTVAVSLTSIVALQAVSDFLDLHIIEIASIRILSIPALILLVAALSPNLASSRRFLWPAVVGASEVVRILSSRNLRRNTLAGLVVFNLFASSTVLYFASTNVGYVITESWKRNIAGQTTSANVVVYMNPPADLEIISEIQSIPNITTVVPMNQALEIIWHSSLFGDGLLMGAEPHGLERLASLGILQSVNLTRGLDVILEPMSCAVSEYAANFLGLGLGDTVHVGAIANLTVVAISESAVPVFMLSTVEPTFVIVSMETWGIIRGEPFKAGSLLIESTDPAAVIKELFSVPGAYPVLVSILEADYVSALRSIEILIDASLISLFASALVSALISSWVVSSSRRRELGMLASLGMRDKEIARTLAAESSVPMISGVILGCAAGIGVELALRNLVIHFSGGLFIIADFRTLFLVVLSLIASLLAVYYVTKRAVNTDVVRLLREAGRNR
ncbi:MAG: hypothetical protein C4K47_01785 [Candidatus Thorarchaeota archaeon]|nr:MAG: hypothetical protein C4K47_01785 [Candidatus Thorarchaeota archaeon]